jgi:hypothetical protein
MKLIAAVMEVVHIPRHHEGTHGQLRTARAAKTIGQCAASSYIHMLV